MSARKFRVVFEQDGGGWHVHIPDVRGCSTWGRSLGAARKNIREALSTCVDVFRDADKVAAEATFEEDIILSKKAASLLARLDAAKAGYDKAEATLRQERVKAAKALTEAGLSLRDAGEILGVSQEQVRNVLAAGK